MAKMAQIVVKQIKSDYQKEKLELINDTLSRIYGIKDYELKTSENGKPYIDGNPVYLSVSNDRDILLIAFDETPIGADLAFWDNANAKVMKKFKIDDTNRFIQEFSKREAIIKLIDGHLSDIYSIDTRNYEVLSFDNDLYTISIAKYKGDYSKL